MADKPKAQKGGNRTSLSEQSGGSIPSLPEQSGGPISSLPEQSGGSIPFLPVTKKDMQERGWDRPDFVLVTGDAYVDHPSFGTALISRLLERYGYKVCILAQPTWQDTKDFMRFGRPKLGFLVNSGNVDSMVNRYSVFKHKRRQDIYSPGGQTGRRPDRAVTVYTNRIKEAYKDVPVIIGGLEASLRRLGHYDYWDDKVRRSVLLDSGADLLIYGMGERAVLEIAEALEAGIDVKDITWIAGTCFKAKALPYGVFDVESEPRIDKKKDLTAAEGERNPATSSASSGGGIVLPSFEEIVHSKAKYAESFAVQYKSHDALNAVPLAEEYENGIFVIQNIPQLPLEREELDDLYNLPFTGCYHPMYEKEGGVPAIEEVRWSITGTRGCFGGCAFCALTYHQGRQVRSRSKKSIVEEAKRLTEQPGFKGYIHDIGGPTANFRQPACEKQLVHGVCTHRDCMTPKICPNLVVDHTEYLDVLQTVRRLPGVKKVFIRSGIRYDYVMADRDETFLKELVEHHISGTLKVAPEHVRPGVLKCMRKPAGPVFDRFCDSYFKMNKALGKKQYLIPYFISSHPGSTLKDAVELALYLKKTGFVPDQVQDFYPTPGTLATCMYYTGLDPLTGDKVYVPKDPEEKKMQRALLHFHKKENRESVLAALKKVEREDLIPVLLGDGKGGYNKRTQGKVSGKEKDRKRPTPKQKSAKRKR